VKTTLSEVVADASIGVVEKGDDGWVLSRCRRRRRRRRRRRGRGAGGEEGSRGKEGLARSSFKGLKRGDTIPNAPARK
jgi:hypothetical protein